MGLGVGSIVCFCMGVEQALECNARRDDARRAGADRHDGVQVHRGSHVLVGEWYPMIVTGVTPDGACFSGQVFLPGNDTLWVSDVKYGVGNGMWCDHRPISA